MKRFLILAALALLGITASAAPVKRMPVCRIQPNGDTVRFFVTGDEYYHRYHDENEFTIIQDHRTGYWVYADTVHWADGMGWNLVSSGLIPGIDDPKLSSLTPHLTVCRSEWNRLQKFYDIPAEARVERPKTSGTNHGTLNNIVIFIRFSDETEISTPFSTIDAMFNDSSANATSMYNYFKHASYNKIYIPTHYYPTPSGNNVISYQDTFPRNYYQPYDATTNPNGYSTDDQKRIREFSMLQRAVNYVNSNYPIPSSINLDMDNDGYVDNLCFVVKGTFTGWNELLWPHKWALYDRNVYINGKRVYTFNLQLEGSGSHYFSSSTFSHEMFHTLGAPDLYHYYDYTEISPVANWDLMGSNSTPPQHMGAYMKYRYGNWMDSIPEITVPGTYSLKSIADPENTNNCYKIAAQEPGQWYVLEYRDNTEFFETALPGRGLLIYRIDTRFAGNAGFDATSTFDEVYLFRPNASNDVTNGNTAIAYFSGNTNRTSFTPNTNPNPWCSGNIVDSTFGIINISVPGDSILFTYVDYRGCRIPSNLNTDNVTGTSAQAHWNGNGQGYQVQQRNQGATNITTTSCTTNWTYFTGLSIATNYEWRVRSICGDGDTSEWTDWQGFSTFSCMSQISDTLANADIEDYYLPINTYYNYTYSQMLYTPSEVGGAKEINKIAFSYVGSYPTTSKTNCTIYLGQTTINSFVGTYVNNLVPFNSLQQVYQGEMNCQEGWNEFTLDTPFSYDGNSNLVVVIDDNSGEYDGNTYKFSCSNTSTYSSVTYYSDNINYDPTSSNEFNGSKYRRQYHPDIIFVGCPDGDLPSHDVTILNNHPEWGAAIGAGTYTEGLNATITAVPNDHAQFLYWTSEQDTIWDNPHTFQVVEDKNFEVHFAIDHHHFQLFSNDSTIGEVWGSQGGNAYEYVFNDEMLPWGTEIVMTAYPKETNPINTFVRWNDNVTDNPRTITLAQDTIFTAYFEHENVGIDNLEECIIVASGNGFISVGNLHGKELIVYDIEGREVARTIHLNNKVFHLSHNGVYLLKVEGEPIRKVVVL